MRTKTAIELAVLCLIGLVLYTSAFWSRDLWNPDEPRYAEVGRQIVASGDWLVMHLNGELYPDKPPFYFWSEAVCMKLFGIRNLSARIPAALSGIGGLVVCYLIARFLGIAPFLSSLILGTSLEYVSIANRVSLDMMFTFLILLAFYLYLLSTERAKLRWLYLAGAGVAAGIAILTKGPAAILWLAIIIVPYLVWRRRWWEIFHAKWLLVLGLAAAIALAWFVPVVQREGQRYTDAVKKHTSGRLSESWSHRQGPHYYFVIFPLFFLPWFPYLPQALAAAWRRRQEMLFQCVLWFACGFVVWTLISSKREMYILPLYPAAAMAVAAYLTERQSRAGLVAPAVFGLVGLGCIAAALITWGGAWGAIGLDRVQNALAEYPGAIAPALAFGASLLVAGIAGIVLWRRFPVAVPAGLVLVLTLSASLTVLPYLDRYKSPRALAEFLKSQGATEDKIIWFREFEPGVSFYGGFGRLRCEPEKSEEQDNAVTKESKEDRLRKKRELAREMVRKHRGAWILTKRANVDELADVFEDCSHVYSFRVGADVFAVVKTPD